MVTPYLLLPPNNIEEMESLSEDLLMESLLLELTAMMYLQFIMQLKRLVKFVNVSPGEQKMYLVFSFKMFSIF